MEEGREGVQNELNIKDTDFSCCDRGTAVGKVQHFTKGISQTQAALHGGKMGNNDPVIKDCFVNTLAGGSNSFSSFFQALSKAKLT